MGEAPCPPRAVPPLHPSAGDPTTEQLLPESAGKFLVAQAIPGPQNLAGPVPSTAEPLCVQGLLP